MQQLATECIFKFSWTVFFFTFLIRIWKRKAISFYLYLLFFIHLLLFLLLIFFFPKKMCLLLWNASVFSLLCRQFCSFFFFYFSCAFLFSYFTGNAQALSKRDKASLSRFFLSNCLLSLWLLFSGSNHELLLLRNGVEKPRKKFVGCVVNQK